MAKMNWDRVRRWDQQRAGMSDAELAEERDERWFDREREREQRHADEQTRSVPSPASGTSALPHKTSSPSQTSAKKARRAALANTIGVDAGKVTAARRAVAEAQVGLRGIPAAERKAKVASRLGITTSELQILSAGLAGAIDGSVLRLRTLIESVARIRVTPTPTPRPASRPSPSAKTKTARGPGGTGGLGPTTLVFVTPWGNVVHRWIDCPSTRGFRHVGEPDPPIYKVPANDPCCRGRRTCRTCGDETGHLARERLDRLLVQLHGPAFDESEWAKRGWYRPMPTGDPVSGKGLAKVSADGQGPPSRQLRPLPSPGHRHRWSAWRSDASGRGSSRSCYECGSSERK